MPETLEWLRVNSSHIDRLAKLGDALALKLIWSYRELYADRLNPYKQSEFLKITDDYCRRDLTITSRAQLADKYGHKIIKPLRRLDS